MSENSSKDDIKTENVAGKDLKCDYCGKKFSEEENLNQHVKAIHKGNFRTEGINTSSSTPSPDEG